MSDVIAALLALLVAVTGVSREVDPGLTAIAEARVLEVNSEATFNHDGWRAGTAEVLAWNLDYPDPAAHAVGQWQGSPDHWAILTDPTYTRIGCAHDLAPDGRDYFVCVLAGGASVQVEPPVTRVTEPPEAPPVELLPNTSTTP